MSTDTATQILINWLQEAHAMVEHGETMMSGRADALEDYPALRERLQAHVAESRHHAADIESAIEALGGELSRAKDIGGKLSALGHSWGTQLTGETAVQSLAATLAFEHFEISNYRALAVAAEQAGANETQVRLARLRGDNEAMAEWLTDNLEATSRRYLQTA
ncbi:DUF892 family protein [Salinisphaera sp.]|uniref:DUF892 family protein n=1 Tax=Salinisphaera sp. TaxID=1914330 RepID=UPI002D779D5E|nr:DUF892 family protein [Salinisphaera sp.]HET7315126.1 DUF892 family protein [Salinisphaera sp.]